MSEDVNKRLIANHPECAIELPDTDPILDPRLPHMLEEMRRGFQNGGHGAQANAVLNANMALTRMKNLDRHCAAQRDELKAARERLRLIEEAERKFDDAAIKLGSGSTHADKNKIIHRYATFTRDVRQALKGQDDE